MLTHKLHDYNMLWLNSNRKSEIVNRKFGCGYAALVMIVEDKINRRYSKQYYLRRKLLFNRSKQDIRYFISLQIKNVNV